MVLGFVINQILLFTTILLIVYYEAFSDKSAESAFH